MRTCKAVPIATAQPLSSPSRVLLNCASSVAHRADICAIGRDHPTKSVTIGPETNFIDDTKNTEPTRKIFEMNINSPFDPTAWRHTSFSQVRQTTAFKVAAGTAVVGTSFALPVIRRWRADASRRPGSLGARMIRGTGGVLKRVLPFALGVATVYFLGYLSSRRRALEQ